MSDFKVSAIQEKKPIEIMSDLGQPRLLITK